MQVRIVYILIFLSLVLTAAVVWAENTTREEFHVETTNVFPDYISAVGWGNVETITFQNVSEYELYQEFNTINSVYLRSLSYNEQQELRNTEESVTEDTNPSKEIDTASSSSSVEEVDFIDETPATTSNATPMHEQATSTSLVATSSTPEVQIGSSARTGTSSTVDRDSTQNQTEESAESTATLEEIRVESDPDADSAASTTSLNSSDNSIFRFALKQVRRVFDFAVGQSTTSSSHAVLAEVNPEESESDESKLEVAEMVGEEMSEDDYSEINKQTKTATSAEEVRAVKTDVAGVATSTTDVSDVDENPATSTESNGVIDETETSADTSVQDDTSVTEEDDAEETIEFNSETKGCDQTCPPHTITLSGFGLPLADDVLEISGAQLRVSLAGKKKETRDVVPKLQIQYSLDNGATWETGGGVAIEDQVSNGFNGGYYLFALPEEINAELLEQLVVELRYEDDPDHMENLFVESVWLEVFTLMRTEVAPTDLIDTFDSGFQSEPLSGDTLTLADGSVISMTNTDENEGETLIIKSDRKTYAGLSETKMYFSVTNTSDSEDSFSLQTYFPSQNGEVVSLREWEQNKPKKVVVPEYRPFVYHCEAGWEYSGAPISGSLFDISRELSPQTDATTTETMSSESSDADGAQSLSTTTQVQSVVDTSDITEGIDPLDSTSSATNTSSQLDTPDPNTESNTATSASTSLQTLIDRTPFAQASVVSLTTNSSSTTELASSSASTPDAQPTYQCRNTTMVRACDSLEDGNTACRIENVKVNEKELTRYESGWEEAVVAPGTLPKPGLLKRIGEFFGFGPEKKEVPPTFVSKVHTPDEYTIKPGETKYFEMEIAFEPFTSGEFWIEAVGDSEYGLLDPFWSSQWQYRLPISIDNTSSSQTLTEYQVFLELDNSLSDFWNNVNNDGSDIRFVQETTAGNEENWYGTGWGQRTPLTIQASQVDENLTDFAVYVDLSDLGSSFFSTVQTDGDDIRITESDGITELPYELVSIDTGAETGELHFKASSISSSTDTTFYIYHDNPNVSGYTETDTYGAQNVWSSNFIAVYHLEEDASGRGTTGLYQDSTSNEYDADDQLNSTGKSGRLGAGQEVDAQGDANEYMLLPSDIVNGENQLTFSYWMNSSESGNQALINGGSNNEFLLYVTSSGSNLQFFPGSSNAITDLSISDWRHVVVTRDANVNQWELFVDGQSDVTNNTGLSSLSIPSDCLVIGLEQDGSCLSSGDTSQHLNATIDEIRFWNVIPSDGEISATYRNQATTTDFYSVGTADNFTVTTFTELDHWVQHFDSATNEADIWVQIDTLAASASSTIYLYYGNTVAVSASDEEATFTYDTPTDLYYVVDGNSTGAIEVYSLIDGNEVAIDGGTPVALDEGETTSFSTYSSSSVISALGPISATIDDARADSISPIGFASTTHAVPTNRDTSSYFIYAPFASTTVRTYIGNSATPDETLNIATGTTALSNTDAGGGNGVIIEASSPVLVYHQESARDSIVAYPPTTRDIFGIDSNNTYVTTLTNNPDPDLYCSSGETGTSTGVTRGEAQAENSCTDADNGTGPAMRFTGAAYPITAIQQADSDGSESTAFWPQHEFGTQFYMTTDSAYAAVVCSPRFGTSTIEVQTNGGTTVESATCTPNGESPGKAYFDNGQGGSSLAFAAGHQIVSTNGVPFYVIYEDDEEDNDETNILGSVQARKYDGSDRGYSFGAQEINIDAEYEQLSFLWYENTNGETPTTTWSLGDDGDVSEGDAISGQGAVTDGAVLRLRMNLLANVATGTASSTAFMLQYAAAKTCSTASDWHEIGKVGSTTAAFSGYNNSAVDDGQVLSSTTLASSTVFGTYEEASLSEFIQNDIAPGEVAEWDWVLTSSNAQVNTEYCFRMARSSGDELITYTSYPQLLTSGPPEAATLIKRFNNEHATSVRPTLEFVASDLSGDDLHYQVQIDDDADFGSPVLDQDSETNFSQFENVPVPSDKSPFNSGQTIRYTPPNDLTSSTTYWWRVRSIDPDGSNTYSNWSSPYSFTINDLPSVSEWYQTTDEQFETDSLISATTSGSGSVELDIGGNSNIGEYGSVTVTNGATTTVSLSNSYSDPVVTASVEYSRTVPNGDQPSVRVFNKTGTAFDVLSDNFTNDAPGTSTVHYVVMEAGEYLMDDGDQGLRVYATSTSVSGYIGDPITGDPGLDIVFPTSFGSAPSVLSMVTTNNDQDWILSSVYDGNDVTSPPTATQMGVYLHDNIASDGHSSSENVDIIVFDSGVGTNNGVPFDIFNTGIDPGGAYVDDSADTFAFTQTFSSVPGVTAVQQITMNGTQGSYAMVDIDTPVTTTEIDIAVDEGGTTGARGHTDEDVTVVVFEDATGTIIRAGNGQVTSSVIDFDNADVGNAWGEVSFTDTGDITYHIEYNSGSGFEDIPDSALPGNSSGFTTSPINILSLDTDIYNEIRIVADLSGVNPELYDWTVTWGQRVDIPTLGDPFDNEKISTTTPTFDFTTTDPQGDNLEYEISWSTDKTFTTGSTIRNSSSASGFSSGNPYASGASVTYTVQSGEAFTDNETYWWRVRAKDPTGGNAWSPWSDPDSFTVDTTTSVSTWFQTTQGQFEEGILDGAVASTSDSVIISPEIGEYGTTSVTNNEWSTINTTLTYNNMVVVASPKYAFNGSNNGRTVQVRNKSSNSFQIKADNYTESLSGSTDVDYIVMEAGDWVISDGGSGTRIVAGTAEDVSTVKGSSPGYIGGTQISFSPPFSSTPAGLTTVSTDNGDKWVGSVMDDGTQTGEITASDMYLALGISVDSDTVRNPQDIDYMVFEVATGTNNGVAFDAFNTGDDVTDSEIDSTISFNQSFGSAPQVIVVQNNANDGADGSFAQVDTDTAVTATEMDLTVAEMGASAGVHTTEIVSVFAFESGSGTIRRDSTSGGGLSGTVASENIFFSDGTGPKFEQAVFSTTNPGNSSTTVQVQYLTSTSSWALIPDSQISGNSTGNTISPIDLTSVDIVSYPVIRLYGTLQCDSTDCPTLDDWSIEWSEGVPVSGTIKEYDRVTNVTSGTVRVAVNGVPGGTGTIQGDGTWSINNVTAFDGDVVTVWVDGAAEADEAVGVFVYDGVGDMTGMELFEQHLSLSANEQSTTTTALLSKSDYSVIGDEDVFFDVDYFGNLSVCAISGCDMANLYVGSGNAFVPATSTTKNIFTHDFVNDGTVELHNNNLYVSGSWIDAGNVSPDTSHVIFTGSEGGWYDDAWQSRLPITIASAEVDAPLNDFPVYVDLSDLPTSFFSNVKADGGDIRITQSDGITEVPFELVSINTGAKKGQLHFKAPRLSDTIDSTFYLYFDNPSASSYAVTDTYGRNNVWSDYEAVWHLNDTNFIDSTGDPRTPTNTGVTATTTINGRDAVYFDGSSYLNFGNEVNMGLDDLSISVYVETKDPSASYIAKSFYSAEDERYSLLYYSGSLTSLFDGGSGNANNNYTGTFRDGAFRQAAVTYDRDGNNTLYSDGVPRLTKSIAAYSAVNFDKANNLYVGTYNNSAGTGVQSALNFTGTMVELKMSKNVLSSEWLAAEYSNQTDTSNFYSVGTTSSISTSGSPTNEYLSGALNFNKLSFNDAIDGTVWEILDDVTVNDDLHVALGTLNRATSTIAVAKNVITGMYGFWSGVGTTTFNGTGVSTWTDNNTTKQNIGHVRIDGSAKTITLGSSVYASDVTIGGNDTLNAGGAHTLSLTGNFTNNNIFSAQTGTIEIVGTGTNAIISTGGSSLYNLTASTTNGGSVSFTEPNVTMLGDLTIATGTVTMPTETISVGGSFTNSGGTFVHNNAEVRFIGSDSETIELNGTQFLNHFYDVGFTGNGDWTFLDTNATTSNTFSIANGNVTLPSGQLSVARDFTTSGSGSFDHNGGEVLLLIEGNDTVFANGSVFNNIRVREGDGGASTWYNENWLYRLPITIRSSEIDDDLTDFPVFVDLGDLPSAFFSNINSDGGDIRVTESDGVTEVAREIVNASTSIETGELYFNASSVSSTTDTVFYLYYGNSGASDYAVTDTYGAENTWSNGYVLVSHLDDETTSSVLNSANGSLDGSKLSANNPSETDLGMIYEGQDFAGTEHIGYGNVGAGASNITISAWFKPDNLAGSGDTNTYGYTIFSAHSAGNYTWLTVGGTGNGGSTDEVRFCAFSTSATCNVASGSNIETDEWHYVSATAVDGGAADVRVNGNNVLSFTSNGGGTWNSGSTIGDLRPNRDIEFEGIIDEVQISNVVRSTAWQDATYRNQATTTDFYAVGSPQEGSVRMFSDTDVTALGSVVIESGTAVFPTGVFSIGGSFDNNDEFDANGGTVFFNSTSSAEIIAPGNSSFYNLTLDDAGGDWTITESATATNAITLTDADTLTINSGITLESTGTFSNNLANASTTWTGATLRLSGGTDFTLNSKDNEGDDYNILSVTGDGDVSMWNSTAATYDTQDTASIYSQDHAGADGDLYIFGEYVRESNTEHWSYETDFDGSDLVASSSERQANIRIANGASVIASTSVLEIVGTSSATTSVDAQGGSFTLIAQTATVTAEYFEITGTDANGFQLMSSTTVTGLDNGVFTIATADAITVDASTVDTNPAAQFFFTDFITAGGNVNVDLSGSPNSFWWFRDGSGDRYGESFDNNDGNPGQIRWDDSNYQINVAGTIYADDGGSALGGPTCDGSTQNVRLVVDGGTYTDTTSCDGGTGEYSFTNISYQGDATIVVYLDTDGGVQGSAITRTPTNDILDLDIYANRVITRHENSAPMDIAHIALYDENDDNDLRFSAATGTTDILIVRPDTELYVWASSTFSAGGQVTLESGGTGSVYDGSLHLGASSTFNGVGTTTYSVGGSIILEPSADLITASSTFIMTATTSGRTITASSTIDFNELTFTGVGGAWNLNTDIVAASDIEVATGTLTGTENITLTNGSFYGDGLVSLGGGTTLIKKTNTLGGAQGWTFNDLTLGNGSFGGTTTPGSNATTTVSGTLTISSAHTLDAGGSVWNLTGSGNVFQENGTFLEDTSTVRYGGTSGNNVSSTNYYDLIVDADGGAPTFTADGIGIQIFNDLSIGTTNTTTFTLTTNDPVGAVGGDVTIGALGTLIASDSAVLTVSGSWDNDGTFTSSNGTVNFDSGDAFSIAAGASSFGNVTITAVGAATISEHATSTGAWTFASTSDVTVNPGQQLAVGGDFNNNAAGAATTWTGSTLHLFGIGQFEINASTTQDEYATLSAAAGTHIRMWNSSSSVYTTASGGSIYSMDHENVTGDLYIFGDYEQESNSDYWSYATDFDGTDLSGGGERQVDVYIESGGGFTVSGGSLEIIGTSSASTTVQNQGSGTFSADISDGAFTAQYYALQDIDADGLTLTGTPTVTTLSNGMFVIGMDNARGMTVAGSVIDANPAKNFLNNVFATTSGVTTAFNASTTGSTVSSWRFTTHYGDIDGESFDLDGGGDPGYLVWDDSLAVITISGTVYENDESSVSSVCDNVTTNIVLAVDGVVTPSASSSCSSIDGSYLISGVSFSPNDTLTLFIDGETDAGATVSIDPISSVGNMDIYENHVIVRHEGTDPILIADMADYDSSDDGDIPFTAVDAGTDTLTLDANTKLIIWDNKEFVPGGDITTGGGSGDALDGTIQLRDDATLTLANGETHSIGGNLEAGTDATFTPAESSVTFTSSGGGRTIDTNENGFFDLTVNGTGSFTSSDLMLPIGNDMTLISGALTLPAATTTIAGSLTTTGGSFIANDGSIIFDGTGLETITAAGSVFANIKFTGSGSWSMNDTNATATGAVIIENGSVTLPSGVFAIAADFRNEGGSFSHNTSELRMSTTSNATLRAGGSDLYAVTFADGVFTMADTNLSLLDDFSITNATATLASGTLAIAGSFDAGSGSFDSATGTILFNSSDTGEIINPGQSSFYNVNFGSGSGGWTITSNATTTNNFTLSSASSFTQQTGTRLYIGNVFTNSVGGNNTSWNGSTLVLDAGSTYTVNSKSAGGDEYDTLEIGANTDIRLWDSRATTTTVADSASLYSQDHAAVVGDLNIYGDFHVGTTTEYWSYATDFDGTALGGSSRGVTVHIADGATTTVDGGSLQIIGDASATTTISNQGSGTYAFSVSSGTFNAEYYSFADLDVNGLMLTSAPTITSLNNGEFILAVDTGSLITLSSTTLSANPSKFIDNVRFASTTAISGSNVNLNATTSTAWTFRDHYGNLSGENFDDDGLATQDCGSIRWDDSSCLLIEQTHYRWRNDDGGLGVPDSEWFDADWGARKRVRIVNNDNTTYATTAVKMTVAYDGDMQSDFEDLRFTAEDGLSEIPHWIERYSASADATVWIQIPSLPASGAYDAFMYYNNLAATSTSSSSPVFVASDDFEDNNISEYNGDTAKFQTAAASAYGGSYGLEPVTDTDFTNNGIARFDIASSSQGHIIRYMQYIDTAGSSDESCALFGVQDPVTNNQNYGVCVELFGTDRLSIVRDAERSDNYGGVTQLASTTVSYSTGWYEIEIDWKNDNTIDVTLFNDGGAVVATTSATDSTYTEGAFGFTYWGQTGGWDDVVIRNRTDSAPSVRFGGEQNDGGATWNAPLDSPSINFEFGDVARLRFAIENTGLDITDETYQLEAAPKGTAPSCESVSAGSFTPVLSQAACGLDPICMATSSQFTDGDTIADLLTDTSGTFTSGEATEDPSNTADTLDIDQNEYTELEYALTATVNATDDAYCLRVSDAGEELDAYSAVAEFALAFAPSFGPVSFNLGQYISLVGGTTTRIYATSSVTDLNGYTDLNTGTSTMFTTSATAACTPNDNDCYISGGAPQCTFTDCAGNSCTLSCFADFQYHATPTASDGGEFWYAFMEVEDQGGNIDFATSPGIDLYEVRSARSADSIEYGSLAVNQDTGSTNASTSVENVGNVPIDIEVDGTDLTDGGSSFIPATQQLFSSTTFTYSACTNCVAVPTSTPLRVELDLMKPTSTVTTIEDDIYWGISIPFGVASNPHTGENNFTPVDD